MSFQRVYITIAYTPWFGEPRNNMNKLTFYITGFHCMTTWQLLACKNLTMGQNEQSQECLAMTCSLDYATFIGPHHLRLFQLPISLYAASSTSLSCCFILWKHHAKTLCMSGWFLLARACLHSSAWMQGLACMNAWTQSSFHCCQCLFVIYLVAKPINITE